MINLTVGPHSIVSPQSNKDSSVKMTVLKSMTRRVTAMWALADVDGAHHTVCMPKTSTLLCAVSFPRTFYPWVHQRSDRFGAFSVFSNLFLGTFLFFFHMYESFKKRSGIESPGSEYPQNTPS